MIPKYQKLKEVICYLEQHYAEPIHIEQLAAIFGYSKITFMSIFKQHTGASCMDYLPSCLEKTCGGTSSKPTSAFKKLQVKSVSPTFQTRQFKQHYHLTPRQYRNQQLKKKHDSSP